VLVGKKSYFFWPYIDYNGFLIINLLFNAIAIVGLSKLDTRWD
jgi:hypothetical protein